MTCPKCRGRVVRDQGARRDDDSLKCLACGWRRWRWQKEPGAGRITEQAEGEEARRARLRAAIEHELRRRIREAEGC